MLTLLDLASAFDSIEDDLEDDDELSRSFTTGRGALSLDRFAKLPPSESLRRTSVESSLVGCVPGLREKPLFLIGERLSFLGDLEDLLTGERLCFLGDRDRRKGERLTGWLRPNPRLAGLGDRLPRRTRGEGL